ncbi:MAG: hypothetical protein KGL13_08235 [Gammaproteobacteria bacterium]|nr:hypothetical protein [Gammaproteobacteria bacterium]MDE2346444.1 hypothetical protein [Gammaproteobacteria bacterium]
MNRLTQAQVTNGNGVQTPVTTQYDAIGDITDKSDTGSYAYGGSAGPHAVTSVSGPDPGTYTYDANGNMVNRNGTAITWNSLNMPTCIDAGGGNCSTGSNWSSFSYAPDKHRTYQSANTNLSARKTATAQRAIYRLLHLNRPRFHRHMAKIQQHAAARTGLD